MDFESRMKKSWEDKGGVSEVVGNILILMITVILFSGIVAFVQQIPVPQQTTKADFSASVSFTDDYTHADLTLYHAGGQDLDSSKALIIVNRDGTNFAYNVTDGANFNGTLWKIGKSWTHRIDGTNASSSIVVTVVDMAKNVAIWTSQVTGGVKGNPPLILQRYIDAYPETATIDPAIYNSTFTFYAYIEDPDGDLNANSVHIDASAVGIEGSNGPDRFWSNDSNGLFSWDFNRVMDVAAVDGAVILIYASDDAGHTAISSYILHVTTLPTDVKYYPSNPFGPETNGLPLYLTYVSSVLGHGFGFYKELVDASGNATGTADTASPTTTFWKESKIFIRFASLSMNNLNGINSLSITDTRTGANFAPSFPAGSNSTASAPFYQIGAGGNAFVYECVFDTTDLPPSSYTVSMAFMNQPMTGETPVTFQAHQMILVNQVGAPPLVLPSIQLYKEGWTMPWGTSKDTAFDVSSATSNTVYLAIVVQDTDSYSPTIGQVRIADLSGASELYGTPPAGAMISKVRTLDTNRYNLTIALRLNNGNQWLAGTNSYTVYINKLNDSNEGVYTLSQQIWIKGAAGKADFYVGTDGLSTGNANFITRYYPYYIQNNNFFTSQSLWYYENSPSSCIDYTISAMAVGDIDGDGGKDILMGQAGPTTPATNSLVVFQNTPGNYGSWQPASTIYRPDGMLYPVTWIAFGDVNGDNVMDFAYSNSNSQIVIYNNTYGSRGWVFNPSVNHWTGTISRIDLKDMTGDGRADLIVLAGGTLWIYDLKYAYDPVLKAYPNQMLWIKSTGTGIKSFDIKDMNLDGRLDIVTVGTSSAFGTNAGGNVNLYNKGGGETTVLINPDASGFNPRLDYNTTYTGQPSDTQVAGDGKAIKFIEPVGGTGDNRLQATLRFDQTNSMTPDQTLRVRARVSPGSPETFYVWVSPDNSAYNFVGQIGSTSYTYYNFTLPSSIMGSQMYVRFTDSLTTVDNVQDSIEIDYLAVVTSSPSFIEKPFSSDTTWLVVRAMNVDNAANSTSYLDVIAAKGGITNAMNIFHWTGTAYSAWGSPNVAPSGSASFVVTCSGFVNDPTYYPYSTLSPTLFDATDINGDGFTDILVANLTVDNSGNAVSTIGYYMNLYSTHGPSWRYFQVANWVVNPPQKGPTPYVTILLASPLYG
jgi:hypothetical protein